MALQPAGSTASAASCAFAFSQRGRERERESLSWLIQPFSSLAWEATSQDVGDSRCRSPRPVGSHRSRLHLDPRALLRGQLSLGTRNSSAAAARAHAEAGAHSRGAGSEVRASAATEALGHWDWEAERETEARRSRAALRARLGLPLAVGHGNLFGVAAGVAEKAGEATASELANSEVSP